MAISGTSKTVVVSGYFNPVHKGHIRMFKEAKKLGNYLIVILNNDNQVTLKGSKPFFDEIERKEILESIKYIDKVVISIDKDKTVRKTLARISPTPKIFANGGDRKNEDDIPESEICKLKGIKMVFNIGGKKIQSSSWLKDRIINN